MIRVTRPGGTVAAAVWDYGQGMEMLRVFWDEAIALSPTMDARDERHMPLSRNRELAALWREHGLQDVLEETLTIQTRFVSFDDYWSPFLEKQGPAGEYVASLPAGERDQLRLRLRRRLLGDGPDRPIVLAARAWAVRGSVLRRVASVGRAELAHERSLERKPQVKRRWAKLWRGWARNLARAAGQTGEDSENGRSERLAGRYWRRGWDRHLRARECGGS